MVLAATTIRVPLQSTLGGAVPTMNHDDFVLPTRSKPPATARDRHRPHRLLARRDDVMRWRLRVH